MVLLQSPSNIDFELNRKPGTYALVFFSSSQEKIQVGKLGAVELRTGFYVYAGSAFGPGGLAARVGRHEKISKTARWHIDYLRPHLCLGEAWLTNDTEKREHCWAEVLAQWGRSEIPLAGFGSSDCRCQSHLFYFPKRPAIAIFLRYLTAACPDHSSVAVKRFL